MTGTRFGHPICYDRHPICGYLGDGLDLSSHTAMVDVVAQAGLDANKAIEILEGTAFAESVRGDEQQAQQYGITGVPFFLIGRYGVSGAQEATTLADAIRQVGADGPPPAEPPA
ncbi:MAG: DsbA family protein [Gammaproteobacteria bacterium]